MPWAPLGFGREPLARRQHRQHSRPVERHAQHRKHTRIARLGPVNRRCCILLCAKAACVQVCLVAEPSRQRLSRLAIPSCSLFQVQCTCERARSLRQCCPLCSKLVCRHRRTRRLVNLSIVSVLERHACKQSTCHACLCNCEPEREKFQHDYPRTFRCAARIGAC